MRQQAERLRAEVSRRAPISNIGEFRKNGGENSRLSSRISNAEMRVLDRMNKAYKNRTGIDAQNDMELSSKQVKRFDNHRFGHRQRQGNGRGNNGKGLSNG